MLAELLHIADGISMLYVTKCQYLMRWNRVDGRSGVDRRREDDGNG